MRANIVNKNFKSERLGFGLCLPPMALLVFCEAIRFIEGILPASERGHFQLVIVKAGGYYHLEGYYRQRLLRRVHRPHFS